MESWYQLTATVLMRGIVNDRVEKLLPPSWCRIDVTDLPGEMVGTGIASDSDGKRNLGESETETVGGGRRNLLCRDRDS